MPIYYQQFDDPALVQPACVACVKTKKHFPSAPGDSSLEVRGMDTQMSTPHIIADSDDDDDGDSPILAPTIAGEAPGPEPWQMSDRQQQRSPDEHEQESTDPAFFQSILDEQMRPSPPVHGANTTAIAATPTATPQQRHAEAGKPTATDPLQADDPWKIPSSPPAPTHRIPTIGIKAPKNRHSSSTELLSTASLPATAATAATDNDETERRRNKRQKISSTIPSSQDIDLRREYRSFYDTEGEEPSQDMGPRLPAGAIVRSSGSATNVNTQRSVASSARENTDAAPTATTPKPKEVPRNAGHWNSSPDVIPALGSTPRALEEGSEVQGGKGKEVTETVHDDGGVSVEPEEPPPQSVQDEMESDFEEDHIKARRPANEKKTKMKAKTKAKAKARPQQQQPQQHQKPKQEEGAKSKKGRGWPKNGATDQAVDTTIREDATIVMVHGTTKIQADVAAEDANATPKGGKCTAKTIQDVEENDEECTAPKEEKPHGDNITRDTDTGPEKPATPTLEYQPKPEKKSEIKSEIRRASWMTNNNSRPPLYRVGLSKRSRIAPLLKSVRK
ncbi:hypothetical protein GMORB2_0124 [Geosmithia morbida]|uniref:Uncharacterized protein n=1 Tax=Geosmithia morbida TaxID=1094350 RepID=A0A9P4Z364_9HYPO|nr:uncharacterized protein GMORB2_0124 [Geosmithia morbida]KAF4126388.1 hypothetical protein GMORB2_0124 [Geosmithia morbida]